MAENSTIEWTNHTFNPWIGCSKIHEGCANCYAEADMDKRRHRVRWGPQGSRSRTSDAYWKQPLKWNRDAVLRCPSRYESCSGVWEESGVGAGPDHCANCGATKAEHERPRVFCASLADVFEDWKGAIADSEGRKLGRDPVYGDYSPAQGTNLSLATMDDLRRDLFALIDATPHLDWLLLTKRPENIQRMWPGLFDGLDSGFRRNVWLGTSISLQPHADKQLPELLKCRDLCPILFVSVEPQLGPMDLDLDHECGDPPHSKCPPIPDWVICGGESGHGARPFNLAWARSLRDQCRAAGVPFFMKQAGSNPVHNRELETDERNHLYDLTADDSTRESYARAVETSSLVQLKLIDRKGGDLDELPGDLRVREFPKVTA